MAIKIEIISIGGNAVTAAFYYPVPQSLFLPASDDQSRVPSGTRLSPAEVQSLKDGTLFEYMVTKEIEGVTVQQIQDRLVTAYNQLMPKAANEYRRLYENSLTAYDGTNWI